MTQHPYEPTNAEASVLGELLTRVEAAEGPDRELDCDLGVALGLFMLNIDDRLGIGRGKSWVRLDADGGATTPGQAGDMLVPDYTDSLDAALALCERVLPGCRSMVERTFEGAGWAMIQTEPAAPRDMAFGKTPELALLSALISAKIAQAASPAERTG